MLLFNGSRENLVKLLVCLTRVCHIHLLRFLLIDIQASHGERMSQYYNANRSRNLYQPGSEKPFKISRSKIDLFIECPRCFYID